MNRVVLVGNLTKDPEVRTTNSGSSLTKMRIAVNDRIKKGDVWEDYANFFDVVVFGKQAESCAQYLAKGKQIAVDGRLRWRSWENNEGQKRSAVEVIAENVLFLTPKDRDGAAAPNRSGDGGGAPAEDDDIPF